MKLPILRASRREWRNATSRLFSRLPVGLLAVGCLCLEGNVVRAQSEQANIGVRTQVIDGSVHPDRRHAAEGGHAKIYGVVAVSQVKSALKLVKPVDANAMLAILHRELSANGFRQCAKGSKPDILLTVSYGRGYLRNPYTRDQGALQHSVDGIPTQEITGDIQQLMDEKQAGFMAKSIKASYEKLFIRVTAFAYPSNPADKPKMLWKTIIVADDPDNRDLNSLAETMLKAGAPLFDKEVADKEIDLYKPLPNGRVDVGTPEVVPEPKKGS
jgi:hypothetical protein